MPEQSETKSIASYANYLVVGHNAFEFVIDFGQMYEGSDEPQMHTRIVTTPVHAKAMLETLRVAIDGFESAHGGIPDVQESQA
jgi:hypothetical protein